MDRYNVLSIDGGGVFVLMSLLLLERIEEAHPGFLSSSDLFAGTSAGAISAIILAADENPSGGLKRAISFWENTPILARSARHLVTGLTGTSSLYSHDVLKGALEDILGSKRLGDFGQEVLAASVQLDNGARNPALRSWNPRSLSNLAVDGERYLDLRAVDVALRSAAAPIVWPIYQGYVDGGLFANDPSMLALSKVIEGRRGADTGHHAGGFLAGISLFSVGEGQTRHHLPVGTKSWGYQQWLFGSKPRLALLELALTTSGEEISQQCRMLLGDAHYYRLNPDTKAPVSQTTHVHDPILFLRNMVSRLEDPVAQTRREARYTAATYHLGDTLRWIEESSWFQRDETAARPGAL